MPSPRRPHAEKLAPIIKHLHSLSGKPATRKKLTQTIANYFKQHGGALPDKTVALLIDELVRLKYVSQSERQGELSPELTAEAVDAAPRGLSDLSESLPSWLAAWSASR